MARKIYQMPTLEAMTANLRARMLDAKPAEIVAGQEWYHVANSEAKRIAGLTGVNYKVVAAVMAALSPMNKWGRNLDDAEALCQWHAKGRHGRMPKVATFNRNRDTALRILETGDTTHLSGQKVCAFCANITTPDANEHLTIDRHAFNAAVGSRDITSEQGPTITPNRWTLIETAYRLVAD